MGNVVLQQVPDRFDNETAPLGVQVLDPIYDTSGLQQAPDNVFADTSSILMPGVQTETEMQPSLAADNPTSVSPCYGAEAILCDGCESTCNPVTGEYECSCAPTTEPLTNGSRIIPLLLVLYLICK